MNLEKLTTNAILLLKHLIETPSFSEEEENTAKLIEGWFMEAEIRYHCQGFVSIEEVILYL